MHRNTWLEIDLDAIADNFRTIHAICGKRMIAVVKADAYGCGDVEIAHTVLQAGAEMLAVSSLDEALHLRRQGIDAEILILGVTNPEDAVLMASSRISATAFSPAWVEKVSRQKCQGLQVHLAVDTGMNRIGFQNDADLLKARDTLLAAGCRLEGVFTHFCCTDTDRDMTDRQFARFARAVQKLDYPFNWIHCDNSDASIFFKDPLSNACRLGISMYGYSGYKTDLRKALALYSTIGMVKKVPAGETIGYGATYRTEADEWIATLPIGYADGFIRANQDRFVYVEGERCRIVGRVCMDQVMIRLPHPLPEGTVVEIYGPHLPLEEMASQLQTIPYEVICLTAPRVTRVYLQGGKRKTVNAVLHEEAL